MGKYKKGHRAQKSLKVQSNIRKSFFEKMKLSDRKLLIERMDKQFEQDLRMRKQTTIVTQRANSTVAGLVVLQKDMREFSGYVWDLRSQAQSNFRLIEQILNRPDMKNIASD